MRERFDGILAERKKAVGQRLVRDQDLAELRRERDGLSTNIQQMKRDERCFGQPLASDFTTSTEKGELHTVRTRFPDLANAMPTGPNDVTFRWGCAQPRE